MFIYLVSKALFMSENLKNTTSIQLFSYIEMKPNVYSLNVCKLFWRWELDLYKNKKLFWVPIFSYFTIKMSLNRQYCFFVAYELSRHMLSY